MSADVEDVGRPGPARQRLFVLLAKLRPLLLALLVLSAALTFVTADASTKWPRSFVVAAPIAFGLFLALFAVYRLQAVRAGRYSAGQAFVQITLAALVFTLLVPQSMRAFRTTRESDPLVRLLEHKDPAFRILGLELVRRRGAQPRYADQIEKLLDDPDPRVADEAVKTETSPQGMPEGENPLNKP